MSSLNKFSCRLHRLPSRTAMRRQRGQSATEYVVVCAALASALGIGMLDDDSALKQLLESFHNAYQHYSHAVSLPE